MWRNTDNPEIDIFVTTYNHASWLEASVQSITEQKFRRPFNIYIYDDKSTKDKIHPVSGMRLEGARQPLWRLRDQGYDTIISRENIGVCKARNQIVARGSAPWMLFLDGDDKLDPVFLEKAWRRAQIEKADIIYPKIAIFVERGLAQHGSVEQGPGFDRLRLLRGNYIPVTSLMKREVFEASGGFDEDMKDGFEDHELWVRLTAAGRKFIFEPEAVLLYRHHPDARSHKANEKLPEITEYIRTKHEDLYRTLLRPRVEWLEE